MMMLFILGIFFLSSGQPLMMVSSMIFITMFYSIEGFKFLGSYWFSYALVLVMLSGVLVVFSYMVSLTPNESFEVYGLVFVFMFMIFMIVLWLWDYGEDFSVISFKMWMSYVSLFNLFLVVFLLGVMLMVVWLSEVKDGAVRVFYSCAWVKG